MMSMAETVTVLIASCSPEDHRFFQSICDLRHWRLYHAWRWDRVLEVLRTVVVPVMIMGDAFSGNDSARLIVTTNPAEKDVLVRPFDRIQVFDAITRAWAGRAGALARSRPSGRLAGV